MSSLQRVFRLTTSLVLVTNFGLFAARHIFQTHGDEVLYEGWHEERHSPQWEPNWELYLLDLTTGITHNLTQSPVDEHEPAWSPDGQEIAFSADRDGDDQPELYVMDAMGDNVRRVSSGSGGYRSPEWSADGSLLAYVLGFGQMHVLDTIGGEERWLGAGFTPMLAPDGHTLLYSAETDSFINSDIFVGDLNSPQVTNLTDTSTTEWGARWSPDGTQIVFSSLSGGTVNIYLMNSDGSNRRSVLQNDLNTLHPAWSADGSKIVFTAAPDEIRQLFIVNTDGSQMRALTTGVGDKQSPVWRPGVR